MLFTFAKKINQTSIDRRRGAEKNYISFTLHVERNHLQKYSLCQNYCFVRSAADLVC